jgi:predicted transcriptional regulator
MHQNIIMLEKHCEEFISLYLPSLRAVLARKLVHEYGLSQTTVAERLGITQPAVSQYVKEKRGMNKLLRNALVKKKVDSLCKQIAQNKIGPDKLPKKSCQVCKVIQQVGIID